MNLEAKEKLTLSQACTAQIYGHTEAPAQHTRTGERSPNPTGCTSTQKYRHLLPKLQTLRESTCAADSGASWSPE